MTYGREHFPRNGWTRCGATVSHLAELVRGQLLAEGAAKIVGASVCPSP